MIRHLQRGFRGQGHGPTISFISLFKFGTVFAFSVFHAPLREKRNNHRCFRWHWKGPQQGVCTKRSTAGPVARSEAPLRKLAEEIGIDRAVAVPGDVRKVEDVKKAVASAVENFGGLMFLSTMPVWVWFQVSEIRTEDFRDVWATNIEGPLCAMREAASIMRQRRGAL